MELIKNAIHYFCQPTGNTQLSCMLTKKLDNYEQTTHPEVSLELSFLARANVNNNRDSPQSPV